MFTCANWTKYSIYSLYCTYSHKICSPVQTEQNTVSGGRSPRHAQNPLSGERKKTLSITHHALPPPPSHHHLYIIHFINWLQRFYRITMSLKRPFVPKSDVKQWFTTTTTTTDRLFPSADPSFPQLTPHPLSWPLSSLSSSTTRSSPYTLFRSWMYLFAPSEHSVTALFLSYYNVN